MKASTIQSMGKHRQQQMIGTPVVYPDVDDHNGPDEKADEAQDQERTPTICSLGAKAVQDRSNLYGDVFRRGSRAGIICARLRDLHSDLGLMTFKRGTLAGGLCRIAPSAPKSRRFSECARA